MNSIQDYLNQTKLIVDAFPVRELENICDLIFDAYSKNRNIFIIGNGGSAATASHFAADINKNVMLHGRRPKVYSLVDNISSITAWANDTKYENVFVEQLKNFYTNGDLVIALSGSGSSPNIITAVQWAKESSATVIGLTGQKGFPLMQHSDVCIVIPSDIIEQIEDLHMVCLHALVMEMKQRFKEPVINNNSEVLVMSDKKK